MEMALTVLFRRVPIAIGLCYNVDLSIFGMVFLFFVCDQKFLSLIILGIKICKQFFFFFMNVFEQAYLYWYGLICQNFVFIEFT